MICPSPISGHFNLSSGTEPYTNTLYRRRKIIHLLLFTWR